MLVGAASTVFVDWPHATRGPVVLDLAGWAPSVVLEGGPDPETLLARYGPGAAVDPEDLGAIVAGVAGYFTHHSMLPAPPDPPTVRRGAGCPGQGLAPSDHPVAVSRSHRPLTGSPAPRTRSTRFQQRLEINNYCDILGRCGRPRS